MKKRGALAAVIAGLATIVVASILLRSAEPEHQGKTLSEWLATIEREEDIHDPDHPGVNAVRAIGAEAVPFLVHRMDIGGTPLPTKLDHFLIGLRLRSEPASWERYFARVQLQAGAIIGFKILGAKAQAAIPPLAELLADEHASAMAGIALGAIGPEGLDLLLERLEEPNVTVREGALMGLGYPQDGDIRNVKALVDRLDDPELGQRALLMLGCTKGPPELILPSLTNALIHGEFENRISAVYALSSYGTNAQPAIPMLLSLRDPKLQSSISKALREIDPNGD